MVLPSSPQPSTFRVTTAAPTARHHAPTSAKSFFAFLNHAGRGPLLSCPLISKSFSFFSFLTTHSTSRLETRSIATLCVCAHYLSIYTFNNSNIRMAPLGPLARFLAQLVVPVVAVLARAIPAAYGQALQNARKAGVDAAEASAPVFGKRISRAEALQVLNLTEKEAANPEAIQRVCILSSSVFRQTLLFQTCTFSLLE